jgi:hypothetical protein
MNAPPLPPTAGDGGAGKRPSAAIDDNDTGLPGFRTWRAVYVFVLASFVLWVVLLLLLTRRFA